MTATSSLRSPGLTTSAACKTCPANEISGYAIPRESTALLCPTLWHQVSKASLKTNIVALVQSVPVGQCVGIQILATWQRIDGFTVFGVQIHVLCVAAKVENKVASITGLNRCQGRKLQMNFLTTTNDCQGAIDFFDQLVCLAERRIKARLILGVPVRDCDCCSHNKVVVARWWCVRETRLS